MTELYEDTGCTFEVDELPCVPNAEDDAAVREARRVKWMGRCGKPRARISKKTGNYYFQIFHCGYAKCPICHGFMVDELLHRPYAAMLEGQSISVTILSRKDTDALIKQMDKTQYLRLPGNEKDTVFFFTSASPQSGQVITETDLDEFDWDVLATRTMKRKRSGKLGEPEKPWLEPSPDAVEMTLPDHDIFAEKLVDTNTQRIVTPSVKECKAAVSESLTVHPDLSPTDETTLATALNLRAEDLANAFRKRGYQVHVAVKTCHVKLSLLDIDWINRKSSLDDYELNCVRQAESTALDT